MSVAEPGPADAPVVDVPEESRFVLRAAGQTAELVYHRDGRRFVLVHTGVPDELSGNGIGGKLVRAAVEEGAARGWTVVPECPFARRWLEAHPDVAASVDIDWTPPPA